MSGDAWYIAAPFFYLEATMGLNIESKRAQALAKARSEPLLFKGDDFRLTDVEAAV